MSTLSEIQRRLVVELDALINPQDHAESERIPFLYARLCDDGKIRPEPPGDKNWYGVRSDTYLFVPVGIFWPSEMAQQISEAFNRTGSTEEFYKLKLPLFRADDVDTIHSIDRAADAVAYLLRAGDTPVAYGHPVADDCNFPEPMVLVDVCEVTTELVYLSPVCLDVDGVALPIVFGANRRYLPNEEPVFIIEYDFRSDVFDTVGEAAEVFAALEIATGLSDAYQFSFDPDARRGHNALSQIAEIAQTYYTARRILQGRMLAPESGAIGGDDTDASDTGDEK